MKKNILLAASIASIYACSTPEESTRLIIGTYTENTGSEGVYLFSYNCSDASMEMLDSASAGNPSFVISPDGKTAFSVNEFNDGRQGVSSYRISGRSIERTGSAVMEGGEDPCNILFTGDALITSNYTGGSVSAFRARDLRLTQHIKGAPGAHIHCAVPSPGGKYVFVTDLGANEVQRYELLPGESPLGARTIAWKAEGTMGPRHLVFSPDGRFAYLLGELGDRLVVFSYSDGILTPIQDISAYDGEGHGSADIHLSPDGRFLYTSHRLKKDGIAVFSVDKASGTVTPAGYTETGLHPRNFAISPDGQFLLCACRDSNAVEIYRISPDGLLTFVKSVKVPAPVCIRFI